MALEPTCLALLALRSKKRDGAQILTDCQRPDGGRGAFAEDEQSCGLTGLALLTLNALGICDPSRRRAIDWLLRIRGKEAVWPWTRKFRRLDNHVRFDPAKFGWPWQPGTCSWVVPTAFAVLALKREFPRQPSRKIAYRIRTGVEMLFDRACPGGGWNAGNGFVYGMPMAPHSDGTAIALLALQDESSVEITMRSLAWLEREAHNCEAPWSLAWAILALNALDKSVHSLQDHLASIAESDSFDDIATLAAAVLALDCATSGNPFKVIR